MTNFRMLQAEETATLNVYAPSGQIAAEFKIASGFVNITDIGVTLWTAESCLQLPVSFAKLVTIAINEEVILDTRPAPEPSTKKTTKEPA
jgi:hypothetical protein